MKLELFGLHVDNLTMEETLARIDEFIASRTVHHHVVINVDKIVKAHRNPQLRDIINACDLVNVDGQPVVWAARFLGKPLKERVAGVDLMQRLIAHAAVKGYRLYFLGAKEEVVSGMVRRVREKHPNAIIAGSRNGYWTDAEEPEVAKAIAAARPDILFVAISSPKKELFLSRWKHEIQAPFVMGVGGSFDVVAGLVKRAPRWMQRCGLEWLFRLIQEPRRMWRRYLVEDMQFFGILLREKFRRAEAAKRETANQERRGRA
jgi:N-acetylglucosaminyldiphosphoundecaprenol N-acetyl-beta-D-mannosaminyltransferase